MIIKSKMPALLTGVMLCAAGVVTTAQANTIETFSVDMGTNILLGTFNPPPPLGTGTDVVNVRGTFNGWAATETPLVEQGSSTVFTNTVNDTVTANGYPVLYIFNINGSTYEPVASFNNRAAYTPTTSGASLVLPTPFFGDSGAQVTNNVTFQVDVSQQINLGVFTNGTSSVEVRGDFNSWTGGASVLTNNPNIMVTNEPSGLVTSNVWMNTFPVVASPNSAQDFKYVIQPGTVWDGPSTINQDSGANRFWTSNPNNNGNLTLPLVNFSDQIYAPLCSLNFSVDMSAQLYYGNWIPGEQVYCAGINGNWSPGALMTNNPSAVNTNIFYATVIAGYTSSQAYKFTFNNGGTVYESPVSTGGNNRTLVVPSVLSYTVPTVYFSDQSIADLLTTSNLVTFTVNMTGASQYPSGPAFNPSSDQVYVNGAWLGWLGWNPVNLAPYILSNYPVGSSNYVGQFWIPMGSPLNIVYKYGIDGSDNEAGANDNHVRFIRSTATGAYSLPVDTFGNQYVEPSFGQLAVKPASGGTVPVSWLGAPNVQLQTRTNLTSGSWVSHPETSGLVWSTGINSTNGLISVTNWPSSGNLFIRLIQQ